MKKIIGIAGYQYYKENNSSYFYDLEVAPKAVTDRIRKAGALPFIVPMAKAENAKEYIDMIDALVLPGGDDVSPIHYNEEPMDKLGTNSPERDLFDLALIEEARKQGKAIFGICRGLQIINVAFGGSLYQDLSYYDALEIQHIQKSNLKYPTHSVIFAENSFLNQLFGDKLLVNSYHHQAIKNLADGLKVIARANDGVIEAIESTDPTQRVFAIQWHPELLENDLHQKLFDYFVEII